MCSEVFTVFPSRKMREVRRCDGGRAGGRPRASAPACVDRDEDVSLSESGSVGGDPVTTRRIVGDRDSPPARKAAGVANGVSDCGPFSRITRLWGSHDDVNAGRTRADDPGDLRIGETPSRRATRSPTS